MSNQLTAREHGQPNEQRLTAFIEAFENWIVNDQNNWNKFQQELRKYRAQRLIAAGRAPLKIKSLRQSGRRGRVAITKYKPEQWICQKVSTHDSQNERQARKKTPPA